MRLLLIDAVGLSPHLLSERTPHLNALAARGGAAPLTTVLPAVTCSAQATLLTGVQPSEHGVVGNGWYFKDQGEVLFWRQANGVVTAEKFYETAKRRDPAFTCAKIFWWWNMGADVTWSITPRPYYPADGRKIPAVYGWPTAYPEALEAKLGPFPFFDFWGPKSGLPSSRWLADAALHTLATETPDATLVYLPHLDYSHQRFGPSDPRSLDAVAELDVLIGDLVEAADRAGAATVVVSEYAIEDAPHAVDINRALRRAGLLEVRQTPDGEILDPFGSRAFAAADHQIAHVYVKDQESREAAALCLRQLDGVDQVLDAEGKAAHHLDHPRAGDLVAVAKPGHWFTYYYWLDESAKPDFAPTVDIHRKPGYDPGELFTDPKLKFPLLRVVRRLVQKKLGFRYLMDVIPTSAEQVKGSHGRLPDTPEKGPIVLSSLPFADLGLEPGPAGVEMTAIKDAALRVLARKV